MQLVLVMLVNQELKGLAGVMLLTQRGDEFYSEAILELPPILPPSRQLS
jgi:hypothetical protein